MNKKHFIIYFILLLLLFGGAYLQAQDIDVLEDSRLTEAETYKLLYENTKENNSKILNTIYWTIALVLGGNLFYTYKFNKRESEKLKDNIENNIENIEEKLTRKIDKELNDFANIAKNDLKNDIDYHFKNQQKEIDMVKENLESRIKINTDYMKNGSEHEKEMFNKIFDLIKDLNNKTDEIKYDLSKEINKNHKKNEKEFSALKAEIMKNKGDYDSSLMYYTSKLQHEIELELSCESTLNEIIFILEKIDHIPKYNNRDLNEILTIIPENYKTQITKISNIIENKI